MFLEVYLHSVNFITYSLNIVITIPEKARNAVDPARYVAVVVPSNSAVGFPWSDHTPL